jgi:hypothetical protein
MALANEFYEALDITKPGYDRRKINLMINEAKKSIRVGGITQQEAEATLKEMGLDDSWTCEVMHK